MSASGKVVFGAVAAILTLGAMQFASGHDLASHILSTAPDGTINRAAKGDRAAMATPSQTSVPMQTISVRLAEFSDTSFLLRIPTAAESNSNLSPGSSSRGAEQEARPSASQILIKTERDEIKRPVACEPMVSVLTEIAKRLQPGRCVT